MKPSWAVTRLTLARGLRTPSRYGFPKTSCDPVSRVARSRTPGPGRPRTSERPPSSQKARTSSRKRSFQSANGTGN